MFSKEGLNNLGLLLSPEDLSLNPDSSSIRSSRELFLERSLELIESKRGRIERLGEGMFKVSVSVDTLARASEDLRLIDVTSPHGFKGGCARAVLEELLDLPAVKIRDIDLVRLESLSNPTVDYTNRDDFLAQKYMHDDYIHGYGVDVQGDVKSYLSSRDFTRNEILVIRSDADYVIFCTEGCLIDTVTGSIELSEYESNSGKGKLFAKAVRWYATEKAQGRDIVLGEIGGPENVSSFDVALQMDRITDPQISRIYAHKLYELGAMALQNWKIPNTPDPADEVLDVRAHLSEDLWRSSEFFTTQVALSPECTLETLVDAWENELFTAKYALKRNTHLG